MGHFPWLWLKKTDGSDSQWTFQVYDIAVEKLLTDPDRSLAPSMENPVMNLDDISRYGCVQKMVTAEKMPYHVISMWDTFWSTDRYFGVPLLADKA